MREASSVSSLGPNARPCGGGDLRALVFDHSGAWIIELDDERSERRRVCDEPVCSASVAPDHHSAALLTATGEIIVIDSDGERVRGERDPRITERSRVIALTRERVVLVLQEIAEVRDAVSGERWTLSWAPDRVSGAVDSEHLIVRDGDQRSDVELWWVVHSKSGAMRAQRWASRITASDERSGPAVATREGDRFAFNSPVISLRETRYDVTDPHSHAVLAFSDRWIVYRLRQAGASECVARLCPLGERPPESDWPDEIALSPDGSLLVVARYRSLSVWDTRTASIIDERCEFATEQLLVRATPFIVGGTVFGLAFEPLLTSEYEPAEVHFFEVTPEGLRAWGGMVLGHWAMRTFIDVSRDGRKALVEQRESGSRQLFEWPLIESTHQFSSEAATRVEGAELAESYRYTRDGEVESLSGGRWSRRVEGQWLSIETARGVWRFAGPGALAVDEGPSGLIFTDDERILDCDDAYARWSRDAFVRVSTGAHKLFVADDESRERWEIDLESESETDLVAISSDGSTIAAYDARALKVFRRTTS